MIELDQTARRWRYTACLLAAGIAVPLLATGAASGGAKDAGTTGKKLRGTSGADYLKGGKRNDRLYGRSGSDKLFGGRGRDRLYGGRGNDILKGGSGNDRLFGASGKDKLYGQRGNDLARGGSGRDRISGGRGKDRLFGQSGNDRIYGGRGNDVLSGGKGNDRLYGGSGRDRIYGGKGNDRIYVAGGSRDRVDCGSGQDTVFVDSKDQVKRCEKVRREKADKTAAGNGSTETPNSPPPDDSSGDQDRGGDGSDQRNKRPNIVLILSDDQRLDSVTREFMPNVWSLLVEQGLTFNNAFTTRSQCCPARASILTGQYPHNTGVFTNNYPFGGFSAYLGNGKEKSNIAYWLKDAGYRTGLIGKYLNGYGGNGDGGAGLGPEYVPKGWDTFRTFTHGRGHRGPDYYCYWLNEDGESKFYAGDPEYEGDSGDCDAKGDNSDLADYDPNFYSTNVLARHSLEFIERASADSRPFFLHFSPFAPHSPSTPAPNDVNRFEGNRDYRQDSFNEEDVSDKPGWVQDRDVIDAENEANLDKKWLKHLRSTWAVDQAVGDIVGKLDEIGELDNTVIVYMSDNGYLLGEHRAKKKRAAYEESIRVPLIVRGPRVQRGRSDLIASNIDLAPTFAELADVTPDDPAFDLIDGRSLAPILEGRAVNWRSDLLIEHWWYPDDSPIPTFKALYTQDGPRPEYKYVRYESPDKPELAGVDVATEQYPSGSFGWSHSQEQRSQSRQFGLLENSGDSLGADVKSYHEGDDIELELYDLVGDEYEMESLHEDRSYRQTLGTLDARLDELAHCQGVTCR